MGWVVNTVLKSVTNALENVSGVKILEVKIGEATVEIAEDLI